MSLYGFIILTQAIKSCGTVAEYSFMIAQAGAKPAVILRVYYYKLNAKIRISEVMI